MNLREWLKANASEWLRVSGDYATAWFKRRKRSKRQINFSITFFSEYTVLSNYLSLPLSYLLRWSAGRNWCFFLLFHGYDQGKWGLRFRIKAHSVLIATKFDISFHSIGSADSKKRQNEISREFFSFVYIRSCYLTNPLFNRIFKHR